MNRRILRVVMALTSRYLNHLPLFLRWLIAIAILLVVTAACAAFNRGSLACDNVGLDSPIRFAWCNSQAVSHLLNEETSNERQETRKCKEEAL